ncbi:MAG: YqgE/AlgH family protein [Pirellulaceae bacterium]
MKSLRGQLLVASPQLPDPNFYRSVVMILDHDEDGAMGLILNRTCSRTLKDIWPLISNRPCLSNALIGVGGPVEGPLLALHNNPLLDEFQVLPGVFFSQKRESIEQLVTDGKSSIRIFLGYAGWGGGQL